MRRIAILILALGLTVTACSGGDSGAVEAADDAAGPEATLAPQGNATEESAADGESGVEGERVALPLPREHKVIQKASISIEAEDTRSTYEEIRRMVQEAGGFVESASIADPAKSEDQPRIDLVVRIPDGDLTGALDRITALGTRVVSQSESGEDVTEEFFDLEARIENLNLLEEELRDLLADVRQSDDADPQKLLQVFNEISRVRGEIEQLEGRRRMLEDLTSLATVEVAISPTPEVTPVVADGWAPLAVARQSLQDLVGALQGLADVAIRFGVFLVPLLLMVAAPTYVAWRFGRRFLPSRDVPNA